MDTQLSLRNAIVSNYWLRRIILKPYLDPSKELTISKIPDFSQNSDSFSLFNVTQLITGCRCTLVLIKSFPRCLGRELRDELLWFLLNRFLKKASRSGMQLPTGSELWTYYSQDYLQTAIVTTQRFADLNIRLRYFRIYSKDIIQ